MSFGSIPTLVKKTAKAARVASTPPPSRSGGTSGKLSIPGYVPKTPTAAPYSPSEPGHAAADFASAEIGVAARRTAERQRARRIVRSLNQSPQKPSGGLDIKAVVASLAKAVPSPSSKPQTFQGAKTVGTPTLASLDQAKQAGTLKVNRKGFATTPEVRKVGRRLKAAKAKAPKVTGPLTHDQKVFAQTLAKKTPLKPRVIAAQELAEESGSAAKQREAEGNNDALNIGYADSGPMGLTKSPEWRNPKTAAKATAEFLRGQKFGASPGIQAILPESKGKGPAAQIAAIGNSGWATSAYKNAIEGTYPEVGVKGKPVPPKLLKRAEDLGLKAQPSAGAPAPQVVKKFNAALTTMKQINSKHFEYQWGGGHAVAGSPTGGPGTGFDCSGAISAMLHSVGDLKTPLTSGSMGSVLESGPGAITVFYNGEHTFAYIPSLHKYWGTSESNPGGGAGFFPKSVGDSEVASGNASGAYSVGHVPGLGRKQALQLGATNLGPGTGSFPGMTLSSGGTSATINPGAGATVGKPGFSAKPIHLTRAQEVNRTKAKLKRLGVTKAPTSRASTSDTTIEALEKKYGATV